ncbi:hypothetical protein F4703DRAFT_1865490 [Phycomyces blakesleeanus]
MDRSRSIIHEKIVSLYFWIPVHLPSLRPFSYWYLYIVPSFLFYMNIIINLIHYLSFLPLGLFFA